MFSVYIIASGIINYFSLHALLYSAKRCNQIDYSHLFGFLYGEKMKYFLNFIYVFLVFSAIILD